eukprot:s552_g43.t1
MSAAKASKLVAIVWASKGGLGDVGKFAAMHAAAKGEQLRFRAVAVSEDGQDTGIDATEVKPAERLEKLQEILKDVEILKLNINSDDAEAQLAQTFQGCDSVIACPGSRQSGIARTCGVGARKVVAAMKTAEVKRLVVLSSMGIGDDYLPGSCIKYFWGFLLRVVWPSTRRDLQEMEAVVSNADLDFLLVRPMGVDPAEPQRGSYALLTGRGQGGLEITVAKEDVALPWVSSGGGFGAQTFQDSGDHRKGHQGCGGLTARRSPGHVMSTDVH